MEAAFRRNYNMIIGQAISKSGRFLFAVNSIGDIFVQDLEAMYNPVEGKPFPETRKHSLGSEALCLCFYNKTLIVGAIGKILALHWDEEKQQLSKERAWQIVVPMPPDAFEVPDVNALWLCAGTSTIFAGCGDNAVYEICLDTLNIKRTYRGHDDYVHAVTATQDGSRMFSASEDGTVRIWSTKDGSTVAVFNPSTLSNIARPEHGKWLGALAVNGDWLLCAGGPKPSLWHLPTQTCSHVFDYPGKVKVCDFIDGTIFIAGVHNQLECYELNGTHKASIQVDLMAAYSMVWQAEPFNFLSLAGFSNKIHILQDFRYVDRTIECYGEQEMNGAINNNNNSDSESDGDENMD